MQWFVPIEDLFKGGHFDRQIIVLCVSWYTSFKLSLRDLVIMMADRGISVTHTRFSGGSSATCRSSRSAGGATSRHLICDRDAIFGRAHGDCSLSNASCETLS